MKTTLDIPSELYRQAKVKAAMEGRKIKDLVAEGLALVVQGKKSDAAVRESGVDYAVSPTTKKVDRSLKKPVPAWYGMLSRYAKGRRGGADMESIRASIARGLAKERRI